MHHRWQLCAVAALTALVVLSSSAVGDDWVTGVGGKPTRNSQSAEVGPNHPTILWQGSRPAIVAQQAVIEGNLLVTPRIGSFEIPVGTFIVAHDLTTGEELWAIRLPFNFPDSWRSRVTGIRDGQVYATRAGNTNSDYLYALDPADGSIIWESEDFINETTTESVAFASNGDIIVSDAGLLRRIDRIDGTTVWSVSRSCPTSGGCDAAVFGDKAYIFEAGGPKITAIDISTGTRLYSSQGIGGGLIQQVAPLVGPDGTVYAPRTQNNPNTDLFVALEDTGTALVEKWRVPMGFVPFATSGVGPDGTVYTYSRDLEIIRLRPDTGEVIDRSMPIPSDFHQPRMAIDTLGRLYVTNGGFSDGALFSFNADLSLRWSVPIRNVNVGGPAMGQDGKLAVCGIGTDLRVFQTDLPGDGDGDGDVDRFDFEQFLNCFTGPGGLADPPCDRFDLDLDGDVDWTDFALFQLVYTGQ